MAHELIMNITPGETRIARMERGVISELHVERDDEQQITGNIYKGVVTRVLPGMQAAFVDIGLEKAAFLYVNDIIPDLFTDETDDEDEGVDEAEEDGTSPVAPESKPKDPRRGNDRRGGRRRGPVPKIENIVKEGQTIVVQVAKEPIRTKGARVTCHISLPGRYVVYMPTVSHIGVSRRIGSHEERMRLKRILTDCKPPRGGLISRTMSIGAVEENIRADVANLQRIWEDISKKQDKAKAPAVIYQDMGLVLRSVRDFMSPDIDRLLIDSEEDHAEVIRFMKAFMPDLANRAELYKSDTPLFDVYGIETEINRALGKKVWLKSGGYLVVDTSEALTAIDINTGRFVGKSDFEETILQTNLEAAEEIAYQLKLRNLGGIIIIDFIDMEKYSNRQKVYYALKDALRKDKVKTTISKISELGLVEMTRKRTRDSLTQLLSESCFHCNGKGHVKTPLTVAFELFREIRRSVSTIEAKTLVLKVHPHVAQVLFNATRSYLDNLEKRFKKRLIVESNEGLHVEKFEITARS